MDYIDSNKEAWEEAFERKSEGWGKDILDRLAKEPEPFIDPNFGALLAGRDFAGAVLGQFCCNNGRELLSLMKRGAREGIGFDIAENQVAFAKGLAEKAKANCRFIATDILKIGEDFAGRFDILVVTIGALCWFQDLGPFFARAASCLKPGGSLFIHEMHPVTNMLAAEDEEEYDPACPNKLVNPYFSKTWVANSGMKYIAGTRYASKTFTSFSHSFGGIVNALADAGFVIKTLKEYDYDIADGMFAVLDGKGIPLSFALRADKESGDTP